MKKYLAIALLALVPTGAHAQTTGVVRGVVRGGWLFSPVSTPLAGAVVTVSSPAGEWTARTGKDGFFVIFGVSPGWFTISARAAPDYLALPQLGYKHICVHSGEARDVSLSLVHSQAVMDVWYSPGFELMSKLRPNPSQTADLYSIGDC